MGVRFGSVATQSSFFKYPMEPMLGIYATQHFMGIQEQLRDYKWTYLLIGSQYLAQRWREVQLNNDIMRLQNYILRTVGKNKSPPRTALRALHGTYKRLRKVYALRPESQRIRILEQWRAAVVPALGLMYLSDASDSKYKAPLQASVEEANRAIEHYRRLHPGPTIILPEKIPTSPDPIVRMFPPH